MDVASPSSEQQLIDTDGEFTGSLIVPSSVASCSKYGVVAVIGCQSGGKSTLLNAAFGTQFPVLDTTSRGRRRTTLGVWGAVCIGPTPLVVLDMEGADSRERGDGARSFESRVALLSLALADVVVANMWAHDVGRHSAANYDLFETVFAHIARLQDQKRVRLLVAIRDYDGHADLEVIRRVLRADLVAIWTKLRSICDASFDDRFELSFVPLPHLKYAREAFGTAVKGLRSNIDTIAAKAVTRAPLAAFDALASAVWDDVRSITGGGSLEESFSLDVPKHAALASHYKLGKLVTRVLSSHVEPTIDAIRSDVEADWRTPLERYATRVRDMAESSLAKFDELSAPLAASAEGAVLDRRQELGSSIVESIEEVRDRFLWTCRECSFQAFEEEFRPLLGSAPGFTRQARRIANTHIKKYRELLEQARYPDVLASFIELGGESNANQVAAFGSDPPSDDALQLLVEQRFAERNADEGPTLGDNHPYNPRLAALDRLDQDSEEEGSDEFALERFMRDVHQAIDERRRMAQLMLPANFAPTQPPWWKGLLIRGAILLINYLQARQGHIASIRAQKKQEEEFPAVPTF